MSNKIAVSKIIIKIGSQTLSLTPQELKELKDVLEATFPTEKTVFVPSAPVIIREPVPIYPSPWNEPYCPTWAPWTVTCESGTLSIVTGDVSTPPSAPTC